MLHTLELKNELRQHCDELGKLLSGTKYEKEYLQFKDTYDSIADNDKIHLVLCGGWSTGKSTIVKALTGFEDIGINTDVKTVKITPYEYKDICIVDTPGFNSLNADHNTKARKALLNSDRIIFCITESQLFDDKSIRDFEDILRIAGVGNPVILAVTKFGMEGNDPIDSLREIRFQIEDNLNEREVTSEQYIISIFNAERYIEGLKSDDDDLIEASYFKEFMGVIESPIEFMGVIESPIENDKDRLSLNKCKRQTQTILEFVSKLIDSVKQEFTDEDKQQLIESKQKEQEKLIHKKKELKRNVSSCINDTIDMLNDQLNGSEIHADVIGSKTEAQLRELFEDIGSKIEAQLCELFEDIKDDLPDKNVDFLANKGIDTTAGQTPTKKRSGLFSVFDKAKKKSGTGVFETGGGLLKKGITNVNGRTAPVQVGKKTRWFKKAEPIMSEIGGRGTPLADDFMKIFPKHGESMAMAIGKISSKAEKFAKHLPAIGAAVDTSVSIHVAVKENMIENEVNARKSEFKKSMWVQLSDIKKGLISEIDDYFEERINETDGHADNLQNANSRLIFDLRSLQQKIDNINDNISDKIKNM